MLRHRASRDQFRKYARSQIMNRQAEHLGPKSRVGQVFSSVNTSACAALLQQRINSSFAVKQLISQGLEPRRKQQRVRELGRCWPKTCVAREHAAAKFCCLRSRRRRCGQQMGRDFGLMSRTAKVVLFSS